MVQITECQSEKILMKKNRICVKILSRFNIGFRKVCLFQRGMK